MTPQSRRGQQLKLFESREPGAERVGPARVSEELAAVARRVPGSVRIGTSSWSFPGWTGIVYDRPATPTALARDGLAAYARHPLLRTVGIDRSYYDPLDAGTYARYAAAVPDDFRFLAKAHELCTLEDFPQHARYGARRGGRNERYLDPAYAADAVVAPLLEGLGSRAGPLVFQFPPRRARDAGDPRAFADRLSAFLGALPKGPLYAVEIRHRRFLTRAYAEALAGAGAVHCVAVHPTMPPVAEQARAVFADRAPAFVARWMLGGDQKYETARDRYAPFDRLVDPDPASREAIALLCAGAGRSGRPAWVAINNKAEGSAPLSAFRLAESIARLGSDAASG